ncbi:peptidase S8, subtilisin-related [Kipferlia bialata]|uniref:Peptidase S8, subtilisin-related n=1 Tax=Kipferlia bialata TaxID=797122 RepID=A0A9K3CSI5_9EUKA|nr:peptidase S8, subtilisin-related [Kipferlia bialata]|eukprot:g2484.t1
MSLRGVLLPCVLACMFICIEALQASVTHTPCPYASGDGQTKGTQSAHCLAPLTALSSLPPVSVVRVGQSHVVYACQAEGDGEGEGVVSSLESLSSSGSDEYMYDGPFYVDEVLGGRRTVFTTDPYLSAQWEHANSGEGLAYKSGIDMNLTPAWEAGYYGEGVTLAVLDDGLDSSLDEFSGRVNMGLSYDYEDDTSDPSGHDDDDYHGVMVAGVAAGTKDNGTCGSGVAPQTTLVGRRLIFNSMTLANIVDAFTDGCEGIDISNNSWGSVVCDSIACDSDYLLFTSQLAIQTLGIDYSLANGRDGLGTVPVFAAGNSGDVSGDANDSAEQRGLGVIVVGAIGPDGTATSYTSPGSNVLIAAPSGETSTLLESTGLTAPTISGSCTSGFYGTSGSAPLVSGAIALMLEAHPELHYRDVIAILMDTARPTDDTWLGLLSKSAWTYSANGQRFSRATGYGLVDTGAAVTLSPSYSTSSTSVSTDMGYTAVSDTTSLRHHGRPI